jgi:hypothetical protein
LKSKNRSEELRLGWRRISLDRLCTIRIIILNLIDSGAHRITSHESVERFEHLRYRRQVSVGRVQPKIVMVGLENDRHSVVNVGQKRIWCGRQDRAALNRLSFRVSPSVPETSESKQLTVINFEAGRLFRLAFSLPLVEPVSRNETTLRFERFMKDAVVATVPDLALIVLYPIPGSFAQLGTRPQRIVESLRTGSRASRRMVTMGCEGAILYRADTSTSP